MKQLLKGRSGRKNTAQATLKHGWQPVKTANKFWDQPKQPLPVTSPRLPVSESKKSASDKSTD